MVLQQRLPVLLIFPDLVVVDYCCRLFILYKRIAVINELHYLRRHIHEMVFAHKSHKLLFLWILKRLFNNCVGQVLLSISK